MGHTDLRDVQYGKIRIKYHTAYYTNTPYDPSLVDMYWTLHVPGKQCLDITCTRYTMFGHYMYQVNNVWTLNIPGKQCLDITCTRYTIFANG